jgi:hypothetical protein
MTLHKFDCRYKLLTLIHSHMLSPTIHFDAYSDTFDFDFQQTDVLIISSSIYLPSHLRFSSLKNHLIVYCSAYIENTQYFRSSRCVIIDEFIMTGLPFLLWHKVPLPSDRISLLLGFSILRPSSDPSLHTSLKESPTSFFRQNLPTSRIFYPTPSRILLVLTTELPTYGPFRCQRPIFYGIAQSLWRSFARFRYQWRWSALQQYPDFFDVNVPSFLG